MELSNKYFWFKSIIPPETCQKIIDLGLKKIEEEKSLGRSVAAYTFGDRQKDAMPDAAPQGERTIQQLRSEGLTKETYVRDSDVAWLNEQWMYDLICPIIQDANIKAGWNWDWDYAESFQFTVYRPNGFYSWHTDGPSDHVGKYKRYIYGITNQPLKPNGMLPDRYVTDQKMVGKIRKISMTLNLNPGEYVGGNLKFDFGQHNEQGQFWEASEFRDQGSMIVFPSFAPHCVTPVTAGVRYSLVLWCVGDPWK